MKVPLEILIVTVLIYVGWGQSFHEQWDRINGKVPRPAAATGGSSPRASSAAPTPADTSWMRRATTLDPAR